MSKKKSFKEKESATKQIIPCPLDKFVMSLVNLSDGYENNSGYSCGKCGFLYEVRSHSGLQDQAKGYVNEVVLLYNSLTEQGIQKQVTRYERNLRVMAAEKIGDLEKKIVVFRKHGTTITKPYVARVK